MKQRQLARIALVFALSLTVAVPVLANEGEAGVEVHQSDNHSINVNTGAHTVNVRSLRENIQRGVSDTRDNLIKNRKVLIDIATRIFNATVNRLENIADRMDSRIAKIEAAGANTSVAETGVAAARVDIEDAKAHASVFANLDLSTNESAKANMDKARTEAKAAKDELKSAYDNLKKALEEMKRLEKTVKVSASSSASIR